jgi:hypothetical protein
MQIDFRKILIITLGLLWLWLMISILYGCSASYHFTKFLNKGGKIDTTERIVSVEKVIKINGKDSIIFVEMPLKCPEVQIPPTRQEIRYKYKIQRDSIETIRYVTKWKTKEIVKVAKIQQRKRFNWFWVGLGIGLIIPILIKFVIKKL